MDGVRTNADIGEWLNAFQKRVNTVTGYQVLVLMVSIWREEEDENIKHPKAEIVRRSHFPS
jgi:hypothetical protein